MNRTSDVVVVGAGVAGLAAAVLLARQGLRVTLFEQEQLPRNRVCGEYVSREVLPFMGELGIDVLALGGKSLHWFEMSSMRGRSFRCALDVGGVGISRYRFDHALLKSAQAAGAQIHLSTAVANVTANGKEYDVNTAGTVTTARLVLGCFGKRSKLDLTLRRPHARRRSDYVGVKQHYRGAFRQDLVALHSVPGGYCGISAVEDDLVNVCYLTSARALKTHGSVEGFAKHGLRANPRLAAALEHLTPAFARPLVISQIDFGAKAAAHEHVLMLGDAAGLIHPLAGNGMAMALRSAALITPLATQYLRGDLTRGQLEYEHSRTWRNEFRTRRYLSKGLQSLFESPTLNDAMCRAANAFPALAERVIRSTHGPTF